MILDKQIQLSDAQALTATAYSTNTIDLGDVTPKRDIGDGEPMALVVSVDVALAGTSPTFDVRFVQSANANLSSDDDLAISQQYTSLAAGSQITLLIPMGAITKRYIGAQYTLGGTSPTITVTTHLVPASMVQRDKSYAKGYTIS